MNMLYLRLLHAALILSAAGSLAAQDINSTPSYTPGQQLRLRLRQTVEDARDNPSRNTYEAPVSLRVLRSGTNGTELEWVAGRPVRPEGAPPPDPILDLAEKVFENLPLTVRLDPAGRYQGVANETELLARIQAFLVLLIPQSTAKIPDPSQRQRTTEMLRKVLTPQVMLSAARKEVDLYFGLSGLPLKAATPLRIKTSAMNPFGATGELEGEMQITPLDPDPQSGEVIVEFRQEFDPSATLGTTASGGSASSPAWTLTDSGEYVLAIDTGFVNQVRHTRIIRQNGEPVRVETTELALQ